jgi:hypothetical protein
MCYEEDKSIMLDSGSWLMDFLPFRETSRGAEEVGEELEVPVGL